VEIAVPVDITQSHARDPLARSGPRRRRREGPADVEIELHSRERPADKIDVPIPIDVAQSHARRALGRPGPRGCRGEPASEVEEQLVALAVAAMDEVQVAIA